MAFTGQSEVSSVCLAFALVRTHQDSWRVQVVIGISFSARQTVLESRTSSIEGRSAQIVYG